MSLGWGKGGGWRGIGVAHQSLKGIEMTFCSLPFRYKMTGNEARFFGNDLEKSLIFVCFYQTRATRKVVSTISALCLILIAYLRVDQVEEVFKDIIVVKIVIL